MLTSAIASATHAIQKDDRRRAAEELARVAYAAEFAESRLQASLNRLANEAATAPSQQQVHAAAEPARAKSGFPRALLFGGIAVVLLGAAGAAYWLLRPAPAISLGALELNASPFAEVMSVTSEKGQAMPLPVGDHWTPLRLDEIPIGRYAVSFRGTDGSTLNQQCDVAQTAQLCTIELKAIGRQRD